MTKRSSVSTLENRRREYVDRLSADRPMVARACGDGLPLKIFRHGMLACVALCGDAKTARDFKLAQSSAVNHARAAWREALRHMAHFDAAVAS